MDETIITRVGIAPHKPDFQLGGYRTLLLSYLLSESASPRGECILRLDDTNLTSSSYENALSLTNILINEIGINFTLTAFDSEQARKDLAVKLNLPVMNFTHFPEALSLIQSEKSSLYSEIAKQLVLQNYAFQDSEGSIYFNVNSIPLEQKANLMKTYQVDHLPDAFPLITSTGRPLFHLASVVDDYLWSTTHIVRGKDLQQVEIFQEMLRNSLNLPAIEHIYVPLLKPASPQTKPFFMNLLKSGIHAQAIVSYMISSIYGNPDEIHLSLEASARNFNIHEIRKNDSLFDYNKLKSISNRILRSPNFTPENFKSAIERYITLRDELIDLHKLLEDSYIQKFITEERRSLPTIAHILSNVYKNEFNPLSEKLSMELTLISQVLTHLENSSTYEIQDVIQFFNVTDRSTIYKIIRWVVLGVEDGPSPNLMLKYLTSTGKIIDRIKSARNLLHLLNTNQNEQ